MSEQFANNASSKLNGAINNSTTTIIVTDASSFPSQGTFRLLLGSNTTTGELVTVTGVSGNTLTVLRGQEGSTAQSWPDQAVITHIVTAGAIYTLKNTLRGKSLDASLESVGASQDGYLLTWKNSDGYWAAKPLTIASVAHGFDQVTADISATSSYVQILSKSITLSADGYALAIFTFSGEKTSNTGTVFFKLKIDGNEVKSLECSVSAGFASTGSLVYEAKLLAGLHTFTIEWKVDTTGYQINAASKTEHADLFIQEIRDTPNGISQSTILDPDANFYTLVDNVPGNGSFPNTNATNWSGVYNSDGYSRVIIFGSATGGQSTSAGDVTLNLRVDGTIVRSVTRHTNSIDTNAFPTILYSAILPSGNRTISLDQTGANSFTNPDTYANLYVYKIGAHPSILDGYQHLAIVSGIGQNIGLGANTFTRLGSIRIDASQYPNVATYIFSGIFEATTGQTAELRLYNVTDATAVSGSTLSTTSNASDYKTAQITLSGAKIYEAQLRITNSSPGTGDGAICTRAEILVRG